MVRRRSRPPSIRTQLLVILFAVLVFLMTVWGIASSRVASNILASEILVYSQRLVDEARQLTDLYLAQVKRLLLVTATSDLMVEGLKALPTADTYRQLLFRRQLDSFLLNVLQTNTNIKDFILLDAQGRPLFFSGRSVKSSYAFFQQPWFPSQHPQALTVQFIGSHPQDYYDAPVAQRGMVISAVVPIFDSLALPSTPPAVLLCNLDPSKVDEATRDVQLERTGSILILDQQQSVVSQPLRPTVSSSTLAAILPRLGPADSGFFVHDRGAEAVAVIYATSQVTGWKILALIPQKEMNQPLEELAWTTLGLMLLGLLVVLLVARLFSRKLTHPIGLLLSRMQQIEAGNRQIKLFDDSYEEIRLLTSGIDSMLEKIDSLHRDVYAYQLTSTNAQIQALQAQINPHFLNNTLQAIKAMAHAGKTAEVSRMVTVLGKLLRYAIYDQSEFVSLEAELHHAQAYWEIQNYRFPGRFRLEVLAEAHWESCRTLKLILQPILENCVVHGFSDRERGTILVTVAPATTGLVIQVLDDGRGLTTAQAQTIQARWQQGEGHPSAHIGLWNVHSRLRLRFGEPYGLTIAPRQGENGCCVSVIIPEIPADAIPL